MQDCIGTYMMREPFFPRNPEFLRIKRRACLCSATVTALYLYPPYAVPISDNSNANAPSVFDVRDDFLYVFRAAATRYLYMMTGVSILEFNVD